LGFEGRLAVLSVTVEMGLCMKLKKKKERAKEKKKSERKNYINQLPQVESLGIPGTAYLMHRGNTFQLRRFFPLELLCFDFSSCSSFWEFISQIKELEIDDR
jgi:hypothetical protein